MKEKLAAQVAHRIVEHIRDNGLETGHHLGAQKLADLFRVSRAPVTEALRVLEQVGVVYSEPNKGHFVARPIAIWTGLEQRHDIGVHTHVVGFEFPGQRRISSFSLTRSGSRPDRRSSAIRK